MRIFNNDGFSIKNVTISQTSCVPGDEVTIGFTLALNSSAAMGAIKGDVQIAFGKGVVEYDEDLGRDVARFIHGFIVKTFSNVSIAKGASKKFNFTVTMPSNAIMAGTGVSAGDWMMLNVDAEETRGGFYFADVAEALIRLQTHATPTIGNHANSDLAELPNESSPLGYFGSFVQNASLPRITIPFTLDTVNHNDPGLTATHVLRYTCGGVPFTITKETAHGVAAVNMDLPLLPGSGTVSWTYKITDSYGKSATKMGSFSVLAYSPPTITNMLVERYKLVPTTGGYDEEAADDGTKVWLTLAANITAVNSLNAWTAVMTYWEAALGETAAVTVTSQDGWTLGGTNGTTISLTRDDDQLAGIAVADTKDYCFRLTITDTVGNSVTLVSDNIVKAGAVFDISPGGVAVGMRSTGTENGGELFQCAYPAEFAGDMAVTSQNALLKVVEVSDTVTVSNNSYVSKTIAVNPGVGWTAIGIVGFESSQTFCSPYKARLVNGDVEMSIRYYGSGSSQTVTLTADVLCLRTSL